MRTHPRFLPDGRRFIYHERSESGSGIYAGSIDGGLRKHLVDSSEPATVAPPGALLFVRGTALVAQQFDFETLTLRGQPTLVADDAAPGFLNGRAAFSASPTGVLAFVRSREGTRGKLAWFDHAGQPAGAIEQPDRIEYLNPAISPDGTRVAVNRADPQTGSWDIWTVDLVRGIRTRITFNEANDSDPVWSPDGTAIAFASDRGGAAGIYRKAADGSGPEQRLFQSDRPGVVLPTDWSRDGTIVLSESRFPPGGWTLALLQLTDGSVRRLTAAGVTQYAGRVSPNGQWLASASTETGIFEVYVQPVSGSGSKVQVSRGGGTHPRWTADGRRLFYWAQPGGIKSVDIREAAGQLRADAPRSVIAVRIPELIDGRPHYDVTSDGRRFLLRQPVEAAEPPVGVIVNWTRQIAR
jgi:Tol biopolymer transport system component